MAGWLTGLILFVIEKDNKYIRFHAMQSILLSIAIFVVEIVLSVVAGTLAIIPGMDLLFIPISGLINLGIVILWIFMMYKSYKGYEAGEYFKLPIIGDFAEKQA